MSTEAKQGLYITGKIRSTNCCFLIDTGSTDTIISASTYHKIDKERRPVLDTTSITIKQVDGTPLSVLGSALVEIQVGKTMHLVKAIFADIKAEGILGMDFLLPTGGNLDFRRMTLNLNGEQLECTNPYGRSFVGRVVATKDMTVPPGHEAIICGRIANRQEGMTGPALIESMEGGGELASTGLVLGRTLVNAEADVIPVRVLNPGHEELKIAEGTQIGSISSAQVEETEVQTESKPKQKLPEHLQDLFERSKVNLQPQYHKQLQDCLTDFSDVFSTSSTDIGHTDVVKHAINTGDAKPIKQRPRRHPIINQQEIDRQVKDLEERGVIEPSSSPWASNVVLVKKKDGTKRLCIDYRDLNEVTIKDAYPVPRIDETLDALGSAKWFSTLDLSSGYWQVALDEEAQDKSTFVVRNGLYRWKVMPFGLTNAPATFERLMEKVMRGLQWEILLIYLDDIIVFGRTVEEEIKRLRICFSRLRDANLKLKPSKCHLFQTSVLYLGHVVSSEGVSTDPDKVKAIDDWPRPQCKKEVRSFLGLTSYYRRFVKGFAGIAAPLHALTGKSAKFEWNEACEEAFLELKQRMRSTPILTYPTKTDNFVLDTDASSEAIGAVLSQIQDGEERVLAYFSRKLSKAERNYCVTRQELLAVVASLKHFRQYLYGRNVKVRTDHASIRWLVNFKSPEGQMARWLEQLSEYQITIEHRPGRKHTNADGLSRIQCKQCSRKDEEETSFLTDSQAMPTKNEVDGEVRGISSQPSVTLEALREAQLSDEDMKWILEAKENNEPRPAWTSVAAEPSAVKTYWAQWEQIEIHEGVVYRRWESDDGKLVRKQVLLPSVLRKQVVDEIHGNPLGGHLGLRKTLAKVKARFYWCGITADVRSFIKTCTLCQKRKSPPRKRKAPLQQTRVGAPMERVAIDLMGPLPVTDSGNQWILVVGEYHTKWMEAYAIKDAKATTVAKKLVDEFICRFGVPMELHSDQGSNFESQVFSEVCNLLKINKTRTTPYNPKSDGLVERFNKTLMNIVAMLLHETEGQKNWDEHLPFATSAYRATPQESTGETPNMMMLGREIRLPIDLTTSSLEDEEDLDGTDYAQQLRSKFRNAHKRAKECLDKSAVRQKKAYDRKSENHQLQVGDFVWLHDPARKKGISPKLQLRWKGPYLVVSKLSDVTLRIQSSSRAKPIVVHVDRLKPCHGVTKEKWEWKRPSDPHVQKENKDEGESHENVIKNQSQHDLLGESEGEDQIPHSYSEAEDAHAQQNVSQEAMISEPSPKTSLQGGKKTSIKNNDKGQTRARNTRYPIRKRTRPNYLNEYFS